MAIAGGHASHVVRVVVDIGSDTARLGLAGEAFPSKVVRPSSHERFMWFSGDSGGLAKLQPEGEAMDEALQLVASMGRAEQQSLLVSEPNAQSSTFREAMAELIFEGLGVCEAALVPSAALTAFGVGKTSGIVVDIGAGLTSVAQVLEGRVPISGLKEHEFAGYALDLAVEEALQKQGVKLAGGGTQLNGEASRKVRRKTSSGCYLGASSQVFRSLKEATCFCSYCPLEERKPMKSFWHELPDGQRVDVAAFSMEVPEALFIGDGCNFPGVPKMVSEAIASDESLDVPLISDIHLAGGTAGFVNLRERLHSACRTNEANPMWLRNAKLIHHKERRYEAWFGGSISGMLNLPTIKWVSKANYHERGASTFEH